MTSPAAWLTKLRRTTNAHPAPPHLPHATAALKRLTATTTVGGLLLVGTPLMMEYVVRPGDTLSEIAGHHRTSVDRIVERNDLPASGDQVAAGETIQIPSAHGRSNGGSGGGGTSPASGTISPDARRIIHYTVRPGDTPSALAVRFHAWTAELIEMNGSTLRVGERIRIPVVLAAVAKDRRSTRPAQTSDQTSDQTSAGGPTLTQRLNRRADPSRATVRRTIERTARSNGVDPHLALAISWQEAGWRQHHVSSANAVGAMQIIPSTGEWMSGVVGRDVDLLDVRDNVTAGVTLLDILIEAAPQRRAIAGYYQGLAGVREHGMYDDTLRYVANVLYLKRRFERGQYPS